MLLKDSITYDNLPKNIPVRLSELQNDGYSVDRVISEAINGKHELFIKTGNIRLKREKRTINFTDGIDIEPDFFASGRYDGLIQLYPEILKTSHKGLLGGFALDMLLTNKQPENQPERRLWIEVLPTENEFNEQVQPYIVVKNSKFNELICFSNIIIFRNTVPISSIRSLKKKGKTALWRLIKEISLALEDNDPIYIWHMLMDLAEAGHAVVQEVGSWDAHDSKISWRSGTGHEGSISRKRFKNICSEVKK